MMLWPSFEISIFVFLTVSEQGVCLFLNITHKGSRHFNQCYSEPFYMFKSVCSLQSLESWHSINKFPKSCIQLGLSIHGAPLKLFVDGRTTLC
ncbi:hypothetical protein M758_3G047800 [Ceratodon purpureus]|uniref:Secreted protein n=1 Tax=Ceratodon purpureus TaxID=3225 RepID=A0A8T0IIL1_CERPU|nr:hypothetical protein KC19_3G049900 [Ceratodon purpureus]KAG0621780.1 hypothetical protein M758_3G047800 [Ceratodon purpureus]